MKHDLEEINAALKLGDFFMPPIGTRLRARREDVIVDGLASDATEIRVVPILFHDLPVTERKYYRYWLDERDEFVVMDFVRVEGSVPPFKEWKRP